MSRLLNFIYFIFKVLVVTVGRKHAVRGKHFTSWLATVETLKKAKWAPLKTGCNLFYFDFTGKQNPALYTISFVSPAGNSMYTTIILKSTRRS